MGKNRVKSATQTNLFGNSGVANDAVEWPVGWKNDTFVPFDYGSFAFVYAKSKLKNPPKSPKCLV
ncbi:hypothetical protein [Salmonella enterica]|uniref:hypothetical protein n=1 Tax=Salmonella enterica TaxID=28901 RepID=UPI00398C80BA